MRFFALLTSLLVPVVALGQEAAPPPPPEAAAAAPAARPEPGVRVMASLGLGVAGGLPLSPAAGPSGEAAETELGPVIHASLDVGLPGGGLRWFLDVTASTRKVLVAHENGYAAGPWVLEQTGTGDPRVGPFPFDTYFHSDTAAVRTGAKYVFGEDSFRPWLGAAVGWYSWVFEYANADRTERYGKDSGSQFGLTFMGGVELWVTERFALDLWADLASPVASIRIENLFQDGWTWENDTGNHVMGPYRFGLSARVAF